jgi:hydroxyacylglutathione hydrolase
LMRRLMRETDTSFPPACADVVIADQLDLRPFGVAGEVIHTPGHTPGSLSIVLPAGADGPCILAGDLLIGGLFGFLTPRRPRRHMIIHDLPQMWRSVKRLLDYRPSLVYLGHGGPISGADLQDWYEREAKP